MADNKKYYYLKLKENFFESDELKILQAMTDGYLYSDILLKLYLKSLRNNGKLMYRDVIPYTSAILATLTGHQVGTVEKAVEIFQQLGLVEILDDGAIYILDIQNFIGQSSTEADRQREYYNLIKAEKSRLSEQLSEDSCKKSNIKSNEISLLEIRDRDRDKEIENKDKSNIARSSAKQTIEQDTRVPVITLQLNTGEEYPFYDSDVIQWKELYPAVDVMQELRNMKGWCISNPTKRKTKRGINRFVNNWLASEQNKGGTRGYANKQSQQSSSYGSITEKLLNENRSDLD